MTRLRTFGIGFLVTAGVIAGAWTPVHADVKAYHGAFCKAMFSGHQSQLIYDPVGLIDDHPVGTQNIYIVCPLIRDRINSSDQINNVAIEMNDVAPGFTSCTLVAQREDITGFHIDSDTRGSTGTGDVQITGFDVATYAGNEGTYSLLCTLTGQDTIYHVHVDELNTTD